MSDRLLNARYEVGDTLGAGGMATVYRAHDRVLDRTVAIKTLREELADNEEVRARFLREAKVVARLRHPNIVEIHDVIGLDSGAAGMVMELIDGTDLSKVLRRRPKLLPELVVLVLRPVADALAHAHAHGIIHRDVKPANILMGRDGRVKLSDFGIARVTHETQLTRTGDFLGTPAYIAPEQAKGEKAGPAADQYSLGAILYEMLTGQPPFTGASAMAILMKIVAGDYPDPRSLTPMDDELAEVIDRALRVDPAQRFADVGALASALEAFGHRVTSERERGLLSSLVEDPGAVADGFAAEVADSKITAARVAAEAGELAVARREAMAALARQPGRADAESLIEMLGELRTARRRKGWLLALVALAVTVTAALALWPTDQPPPRAGLRAAAVPVDAAVPAAVVPPRDAAPRPRDAARQPPDAAPRLPDAAPPVTVRARPKPHGRGGPTLTPRPPPPPAEPPKAARLVVLATPWAEVYIDGQRRGRTPYFRDIELPAGEHRLELRNPGFPVHRERIVLGAGEHLTRRVRLRRAP